MNILTPKYLLTPSSCSTNHILVVAPSWVTIYLMSKSWRYFSSFVFLTFYVRQGRTCRTCNLFLCKSSHLTTTNIICGQTDSALTTCCRSWLLPAGRLWENWLQFLQLTFSPRSRCDCWAWTRELVGLPWARADLNCWSWRIRDDAQSISPVAR